MIAKPPRPLVIGYGNVLRSDDGFGWHVASLVAADPRAAGATVLQRHQLTPELAVEISQASLVVFVDARRGRAGELTVEPLAAGSADDASAAFTHQVDPAVLLVLAADLYGGAPEAVVVAVGIESDDAGEQMSAPVAAAVAEAVEAVLGLITSGGTAATAEPGATAAADHA